MARAVYNEDNSELPYCLKITEYIKKVIPCLPKSNSLNALYWKVLLWEAPNRFESFLLYMEKNRPYKKKFYEPRMNPLNYTLGIDELNVIQPNTDNGSGSGSGGSGGTGGSGSNNEPAISDMFETIEVPNSMKDLAKMFEDSVAKSDFTKIGRMLNMKLCGVLESIDWHSVYKKAENFGKDLATFLNGLISPRLFYDLGATLANAINTAFHFANAFAVNFDWTNLGASLASSLKGFFENWDAKLTGETLSNFAKGILKAMTAAIKKLQKDETFKDIGQKLVDFVCGIDWAGLAWDLSKFVKALAEAATDFPKDFALGIAQGIVDKICGADNVKISEIKWVSNIADLAFKILANANPLMAFTNIIDGAISQFERFRDFGIFVGDGLVSAWQTIQNAWSAAKSFFADVFNGQTYDLTFDASTGEYKATVPAPQKSSYSQSGHKYGGSVVATDDAGNSTTITQSDTTFGENLLLRVLEKVAPTLAFTYPTAGAYITNATPVIKFKVTDNDSGVNPDTIVIKVDGAKVTTAFTKTAATDGYECSYTPGAALADGAHTVSIEASDYDGNAASAKTVSFTVDTIPPTLTLTNPVDGLITNKAALVVSGKTDDVTSKPVTVTVNGESVTVNSNGSFSKEITLVSGSNTITVVATDKAGKTTTVTRKVTLDTGAPVFEKVTLTPNPVDCGKTFVISVKVTD